jgi:cytochrome b
VQAIAKLMQFLNGLANARDSDKGENTNLALGLVALLVMLLILVMLGSLSEGGGSA